MKRLVFIVEGDTELILVQNLIIPYLASLGFTNPMHGQTITTNRKQHKKGGVGSYGKFRNEITRTLAQGNVMITTLIDLYGLPTDFPSFAGGIDSIEAAVHRDFDNSDLLVPYIQKYETGSIDVLRSRRT